MVDAVAVHEEAAFTFDKLVAAVLTMGALPLLLALPLAPFSVVASTGGDGVSKEVGRSGD